MFDLINALLCTEVPIKTLIDLSFAPEHCKGQGALFDERHRGEVNVERLRV